MTDFDVVDQLYRNACDAAPTPATIWRPSLSIDGNKWCALYGLSLQDGLAGFGDSPAEAMADFNRNWCKKLPCHPARKP